jgi:hypothetical protein
VPLTRALANAGEYRDAGVPLDRGTDQLHDQHGLAHPGPAEHRGLAACDQWRQQVDDLDAGVKDLARAAQAVERGRGRVNRRALDIRGQIRAVVGRRADRIEKAPQHCVTNRRADSCPKGTHPRSAPEPRSAAKYDDRTTAGPKCCCTSATKGGPRSQSIAIASLIAGRVSPAKAISTTEP